MAHTENDQDLSSQTEQEPTPGTEAKEPEKLLVSREPVRSVPRVRTGIRGGGNGKGGTYYGQ